ncbi:hypothetical protein J8V57_13620 [Xenorhabdus sp. PB61.4]|uniref:hypothetical protein n=1 Tax=Xenorhabdus sp. PB61.4 TaxID=2788940 RepID=UPI001E31EE83|nr:hypothetical protein [Xenorhabdus sp. PB61.4]MCC8367294.1 hypothetical protein [Xenorhabdus sp. PB61.4]
MNRKSRQLEFFLVSTLMCITGIFVLTLFIMFIVNFGVWLFISGEFLLSFEDVKKAFKIGVLVGPLISVGEWWTRHRK